jgi:hypothetical protein
LVGIASQNIQLAVGITAFHINERVWTGEDTGTRADVEIAALAHAAEAKLVSERISAALGSGVSEFTFDTNDCAAKIEVIASPDARTSEGRANILR